MTTAKIIKKIDLKATLSAMQPNSVLTLPLKAAKYSTVYRAVKTQHDADRYEIRLDTDNLATIVKRL